MKNIVLISILTLSLAFVGCGKSGVEETSDINIETVEATTEKENTEETTTNVEDKQKDEVVVSSKNDIAAIKTKYETRNNIEVTPFYNVNPDTEFVFRFNSKVEPMLAVTVHTDSECEDDSLVYQLNDAYVNSSGYDIVVKPKTGLFDNIEGEWGKAPIYYLAINYDMDANTVTKLLNPIVIPFTVYRDVSTPNIEYYINDEGNIEITWGEIEGAIKYNIYSIDSIDNKSPAKGINREKCGFIGDTPNLLDSTEELSFIVPNKDIEKNKYIVEQNTEGYGNYFVTAVDTNGNESNFSKLVNTQLLFERLPVKLESSLNNLPDVAQVTTVNQRKIYLPVKYTKIAESASGSASYKYEILGSKLSGEVNYTREDKVYPVEILPISDISNDIITGIKLNEIPANNINLGIDYSIEYEKVEDNLVTYSDEVLAAREDIEKIRESNEGLYMDGNNPNSVVENSVINDKKLDETKTDTNSFANKALKLSIDNINVWNNTEIINDKKIFATTAEEEYLASMLVAGVDSISLKAFPSLTSAELLNSTLNNVIIQNPYIFTVNNIEIDYENMGLLVTYGESFDSIQVKQKAVDAEINNIASTIFNDSMSDVDKLDAIWNYLLDNTKYDNKALDKIKDGTELPYDAVTVYGVTCKKIGTSKSYIDTFKLLADKAGIEVKTVNYLINTNENRIANLVKVNDVWYLYDITLDILSNTPYVIYKLNRDLADEYKIRVFNCNEFNRTGSVSDYYSGNSSYVNNFDDLASLLNEKDLPIRISTELIIDEKVNSVTEQEIKSILGIVRNK